MARRVPEFQSNRVIVYSLPMPANIPPSASKAKLLIDRIDSRQIGVFSLVVAEARPIQPRAGWLYIRIALRDRSGAISSSPIATGIVSGGGRGVMPWLEGRLLPIVNFANRGAVDARAIGLEAEIVKVLSGLIPPGGHLMLDYEHPGQQETFAELALGVPPAASYLGSLMFRAGCRGEFKDWYFSECGHEGPRKLQANKSPDAASRQRAMREHLRQLRAFIRGPIPPASQEAAIITKAKARARLLLKELALRASPPVRSDKRARPTRSESGARRRRRPERPA